MSSKFKSSQIYAIIVIIVLNFLHETKSSCSESLDVSLIEGFQHYVYVESSNFSASNITVPKVYLQRKFLRKLKLHAVIRNADKCSTMGVENPPYSRFRINGLMVAENIRTVPFPEDFSLGDNFIDFFLSYNNQNVTENLIVTVVPDPDTIRVSRNKVFSFQAYQADTQNLKNASRKLLNVPFYAEGEGDLKWTLNDEVWDKNLNTLKPGSYSPKICKGSQCDSVELLISETWVPEIEIECIENCQEFYNPAALGMYRAKCVNCGLSGVKPDLMRVCYGFPFEI